MAKRVNITMEEYLLEELDYMAEKRGLSRSAMLAFMVCEEFNKFQMSSRVGDDYHRGHKLMD